jgi:hypothetical protein
MCKKNRAFGGKGKKKHVSSKKGKQFKITRM